MRKLALLSIICLAVSAQAITWNSVPLAGGANPDSYRSFLLTDPATGDIYYSKWNGNHDIYKLPAAKGHAYGVTTPADWTTFTAPAQYSGGDDNWGAGYNIYNGYLYAGMYLQGVGATTRQFVRVDTTTGAYTTAPVNLDNTSGACVAHGGPNGLQITGKWTGWTVFVDYTVTSESGANFTYNEVGGKTQGATGYWGSDGAVGTDGKWYFVEPGANGKQHFFRRASLNAADMSAELAQPWVNVSNSPNNTNNNRRTNTALEFVPGGIDGVSGDELWLMPMNWDGVLTSKIYRYAAADGTLLGDLDMPFVSTDAMGNGYDLAYSNGYIYVMQGRGAETLWSARLPEPASLILLGLAGLFLRRR